MGVDFFKCKVISRCNMVCGLSVGLLFLATTPRFLHAQFTGPALTMPSQPREVLVPNVTPSLLDANEADQTIDLEDIIAIHIFESLDYLPTVKVNVDGTVELPLIGLVHVAGLTIVQAQQLIADKLIAGGFYRQPQVSVDIVNATNRFATITGEIHAVVPLLGVRRLFDVLAAGGIATGTGNSTNASITSAVIGGNGWPASASHTITIIRAGEPKPIIVNIGTDPAKLAEANIVIRPHDVIVLSKVGVVYIVGAFARQGAIPLDQNAPLTLLQATALSGGKGFEGRNEDLRIIRTIGGTRTMVRVDIKKIERGQNPDPILQADDIVFLPTNIWKGALKAGGIGTLIGLADAAVILIQHN